MLCINMFVNLIKLSKNKEYQMLIKQHDQCEICTTRNIIFPNGGALSSFYMIAQLLID